MRILVTGVTGQVGGAIAARLHGSGSVLSADRSILDLSRLDRIACTLDRLAPAIIVNPAAYTAVDKAEDEPDLAMVVNAKAPGAIARWAASRAVPLIHFSTDYVFNGAGDRPWREEDEPQPLSVYGATKLAGENEIRAAGGCFLILRTSWVYAAEGKNFLRTIARLARERKELRVVADQIGAPTPAGLVADAVASLVADGIDDLRKHCSLADGLVHFSASGETSWHGFACMIVGGLRARGSGLAVDRIVAIPTEQFPTRAKRPRNSRLDLGRWRSLFKRTPPAWAGVLEPVLDQVAQAME
jgi:dTDP-4-dehydrorhamnose reductase